MSHTHSLTGEHIQRTVYDPDTESLKVSLQPIEMGMELDHTDGDSVYAYKKNISQELTSGQEYDISSYSSITIYHKFVSNTDVLVEVSPGVGMPYFILSSYTPVSSLFNHHTLNADKIKITFSAGNCYINARV